MVDFQKVEGKYYNIKYLYEYVLKVNFAGRHGLLLDFIHLGHATLDLI